MSFILRWKPSVMPLFLVKRHIAEYSNHAAPDNYYLAYMAAWACAKTGDKERALKIDNAVLDRDPSFDPAYELLTQLSGIDCFPRLALLLQRDRFQPRPLIWKAQVELDNGKLDAAEKDARVAIAIDPSDGEQGPGRRMRAYSVLADILDRKGDKEHATIYHGAVDAIRLSEHADRFYEAGLITRAAGMYAQAPTHFSDAYCIQSRLALRLAELGDNAGAEEHYRRAYELMPESFGRVESHCFGCERAFAGYRPQSIAEQVFNQLAVKMPNNPQVHYLLGYLRTEQDRYADALPEFQKAVKIDPDYFNAWKKIGEVSSGIFVPVSVRNETATNEARLDPLGRHDGVNVQDFTDLAAVWNAAAAAKDLLSKPSGPLMPMNPRTSAGTPVSDTDESSFSSDYVSGQNSNGFKTPGSFIYQNRLLQTAGNILLRINSEDGGD
jgi:tetratricopeptide (TPR) repeat protein